ncbi:MAG: hypothetical protein COA58_12620 [Bacteroidetes bacterium]|nr:MAG: hypothetical protein COA58_12620 [Bacteroidota bacterium]
MRRLVHIASLFTFCCSAFAQAPSNDSCQNATILTMSTTEITDTFRLKDATSNLTGCGSSQDVWYKFEVPSSGAFKMRTSVIGGSWNQYLRLYTGSCGSLTTYACQGTCQYYSGTNCGDYILLKDASLAGDTVYIRISGRFSNVDSNGSIIYQELSDSDFPVNDSCGAAQDVSANLYSPTSDTLSLLNALVETNLSTCGTANDIWVKFKVPSSGGMEMSTTRQSGSWNQYLRVYTGGCASLADYACDGTCDDYNATSNCGDHRRIINPSIAGDTLWVKISNRFGNTPPDSFSFNLSEISTSDFAPNDSCGDAIDISTNLYTTASDTLSLKNAIVETNMATCGSDEDVWVKFEVPSSGGFEMSTTKLVGTWNQYFRVYTGGCASLTDYACDGTCDSYNATSNCGAYRKIIDPSIIGDTVWVRIANRFNNDVLDSFSLNITEIPTSEFSVNDSCQAAIDLSSNFGSIDTFTLLGAIANTNLATCGDDQDVWFKFKMPSSGGFELRTTKIAGTWNQYLRVYTGGCGALSIYNCVNGNCNNGQTNNCSEFLRVIDPSIAGDSIWVRIANRFSGDVLGSFSLRLDSFGTSQLPGNDNCEKAQFMSVTQGNCVLDTFNNMNATFSSVPSGACGAYSGADVWFAFEVPSSDDVFISMEQVDVVSSNFRIVAYSGSCASLVEEDCNSSGNYPDLSLRNLGLAGDTVYLQVYRASNSEVGDTFGLCVKDTVLPPIRVETGQYERSASCSILSGSGWFDMVDSTGRLLMSIDPNGSYLGATCFGINIEDSSAIVRTALDTFGNMALLSPRNFYITPQFTNRSAIVRLYFNERELAIWRDSLANRGIAVGPSLEIFYTDSMRISKMDEGSLTNYLGANPIQINPTMTLVRDSVVMAEFSITSFSNFVPIFNPGNVTAPVPVEWLSFIGRKRAEIVNLEWITASEINCSHFEIQRSVDEDNFRTVGIEAGNGTTTSISKYSFNHSNMGNEKSYYRLKQIDFDGNFSFSEIIVIKAESSIHISPNPFKNSISVSVGHDEIQKVELLDLYGRTIYSEDVNSNLVKLEFRNGIEHGIYILRIITDGEVIEKKVVKE